ncbi:CMRF35-like molecule 7 [Tiliqua scincoides]|uniref:CMRF35-like molecule 7 n=1 Tax=Tiliqua scincoides TaxID=71010 RepID=UPI003461F530
MDILSAVCWALKGPKTVTGPAGGSVSVQCQYSRGYEEFVKYWCKETGHRQCGHHIQKTGSEAEVKQNRISIQDDHALRIFKVTMENLTNEDAGTYLCGVEKTQYDIWHPVEVKVAADYTYMTLAALEMGCGLGHGTQSSNNVMLLAFKIPIFLAMIVAVVFVHIWSRRGRVSNAKIPVT